MTKKQLQKTINKLVDVSFKDDELVESQVVKAIKALKSLPTAPAINALTEYLKQLKFNQRQHTLYLETVVPLSFVQVNKIKQLIDKEITKVVTQINPEILGGFKLRLGDEVWDGSILGKLNQVKEAIISG